MKRRYQIIGKRNRIELVRFLVMNGQALLLLVQLVDQSWMAVDELIDVLGRAQIEAVLRLSAERVAGPSHPGRKGGAIGWHGREQGTVCLRERRLRVERTRLRRKRRGKDGEVAVPAYEAMRADEKMGPRMLEILLRGVSTRQYEAVLSAMAETVGVSRSAVSREAVKASDDSTISTCW